jgi:hypothetical protein
MVEVTDINKSLRSAVLTVSEEELEDLNTCLDVLIAKQTEAVAASAVDGQDIDEVEQTKLNKFTTLKNDLVEGEQKIISRQIFDMVNAVNTKIGIMERLGEDDSEPEDFDRYQLLLADLQLVKQEMEKDQNAVPFGSYK